MKARGILMVALSLLMAGAIFAGELGNQYPLGVEGIKCGSVPPPGFYLRNYNFWYHSHRFRDDKGKTAPIDPELDVLAFALRPIWISDFKILEANIGADALIPFVYTDLELNALGVEDDAFGIGDLAVEPLILGWHLGQFDLSLAVGFFAPSGDWDELRPAYAGKDYWTGMITWGATAFFDEEKTWALSILPRYEIHSERDDTDVKLGDDFHVEWGFSKTIDQVWDMGIVGYMQFQVTKDKGSDVTWDKDVKDRVFAIGPEVSYMIMPIKLLVSLRNEWEFAAKDRPEGMMMVLTLTKIF